MSATSSLEDAFRRLAAALDRVESAFDEHVERGERVSGMESELHRLGTDRSQLAQSLDVAEARSARLEDTNREVSRRLVGAMEAIRDVLNGGGAK